MLLFFASNALYPTEYAKLVTNYILNPTSYAVDALRIMITGNFTYLINDLKALGISTLIFASLATMAFRRSER
ncbi:MAG TPA: hypothetical protein VN704_05695 [Verrucomicrobiae bacterium]|nr:hypothetical protein [Verrucomicrobiae bacterium]